LGIYPNIQ